MIEPAVVQLRNLYEDLLKKKKKKGEDSDQEPELEAIRCFIMDHLSSKDVIGDGTAIGSVHFVDEINDICDRSESVASHIAFDVMPLLLQTLQSLREQQAVDENETSTPMMKALERLLQLLGQKAPAREVYSIVMEAVAHSMEGKGTDDVRFVVLLIDMLRNALLRMGDAIRFKFMSSALPTLLSKTKSILRLPISSANVMHDSEWLQKEQERKLQEDSIFARYTTELVAFIKPFTKRFSVQTETDILNDTSARRERQWVLTFCFHLLARIFSSHDLHNQFRPHEVPQLMHIITQCNCGLVYLLQYDQRYREWIHHKQELEKREIEEREARNDDTSDDEEEEEDFSHVREEISQFVQWNPFGVGVFAFLLLVHGIERNAYEYAVLSNVFLFILCKPYMEYMMQSNVPYLSLTGKQFSEHMMQCLPNYSLKLRETDRPMHPDSRDKTLENYFLFMQAVINFMASCPDDEQRTQAYHLLNAYISKFYDDGRFELLRHSIRTCPYPVLLGLLVHRLKEEIRLEYDSFLVKTNRKLNPQQPYQPLQPTEHQHQHQHQHEHEHEHCHHCQHDHNHEHHNHDVSSEPPIVQMDRETVEQMRLMAKESAFLSNSSLKLLIECMPQHVQHPNIENADVLLHGLNTFYFLLLRDAFPNVTGIMDADMQETIQDKIIQPLLLKIDSVFNEAQTTMEQSHSDNESDVSFDSDKFDEEMDAKLASMTEEEIEQFLANEDDESDDEDKDEYDDVLPKDTGREIGVYERNVQSGIQHEKAMLHLRFTMIKDCLMRIQRCLNRGDEQS